MGTNLLGVLVVHVGVAAVWLLMKRVNPSRSRLTYLGHYLVLMPLGFAAWRNPEYLLHLVLALAGLTMLAVASRRTKLA